MVQWINCLLHKDLRWDSPPHPRKSRVLGCVCDASSTVVQNQADKEGSRLVSQSNQVGELQLQRKTLPQKRRRSRTWWYFQEAKYEFSSLWNIPSPFGCSMERECPELAPPHAVDLSSSPVFLFVILLGPPPHGMKSGQGRCRCVEHRRMSLCAAFPKK